MEKINNSLALIANIGVIAGIIFLGLEIQQNTNMMQAQTRSELSQKQMDWLISIATDEFAATSYYRCRAGLLESAGPEQLSCNFITNANLRIWENEWYQYEQGLFDEEEYLARRVILENAFSSPDSLERIAFENGPGRFSLGFQEQMEEIIANAKQ